MRKRQDECVHHSSAARSVESPFCFRSTRRYPRSYPRNLWRGLLPRSRFRPLRLSIDRRALQASWPISRPPEKWLHSTRWVGVFVGFGYMGFLREKDARYQVRGFGDTLRTSLVFVSQATVSPERILEEDLGWEKFLKDWSNGSSLGASIGVLVTTDLYCRHLIKNLSEQKKGL